MKRRGVVIVGIGLVSVTAVIVILGLFAPAIGNIYSSAGGALADTRFYGGEGVGAPAYAATQPAQMQQGQQGQSSQGSTSRLQGGGQLGGEEPIPQERIVIRNATVSLIVADPQAKLREIGALAESMGGWIVNSNTSGFTNARGEPATRGSITVRVPAEQLDQALEQIRAGVIRVTGENVTGQDVTQDYIDTESRLRNLEAAEVQLQQIMDQADDVEEVMVVYNQLTVTRGEIEVARGRLQYYEGAAAYSAITVNVEPDAVTPLPSVQAAGWNPLATLANALSGLMRLTQGLIDVGITLLVYGIPLAVIVGVPVLILRARRPRPAPRPETPPAG